MKYYYILPFPLLLFTSCTSRIMEIGFAGIIALFVLMFILFGLMFFLIARRKKKGEKSLVKFNNDIAIALSKFDTAEQKINMLNMLIARIEDDEKYKKDEDWQKKVLAKAHMHLATIHYRSGDEIQTLNSCTKVIELDDTDGMVFYNRGSIYSNRGMYEKALQDLDKTIELIPDFASAYNNRGLVHEKLEHYEEAIEDFDKAIELEGSPIAYFNRGNTYYEMERYQEALESYESSFELIENASDSELKEELEISVKATKEKLTDSEK
ncbi:tetratricopeptide repeat protein [Dysgonomonas sp. Marseille-P4361]|uniref:tetratricopeptide repeat protein n=1 Tax=Dysgonomonas sp. Marseille-P4361 TaxID=2161820 RepID=UPI000D561B9E|nr:tetratricopeptide repeat protein [Dysgonomonas sp. Marseille-P4361]